MNLLTLGESSGASVQPPKRKRGRPRKDQSLEAGPSVGVKEHRPPISRGPEPVLGLEVVGVIEHKFDCGYLLSVKVGNSNMRGVVFHPGQCVPITPANDVAPHLPMTKRKKTRLPGKKQKVAVQTASENGGIAERLQALQGDVKEGKVQICEELACVAQVELEETKTMPTKANANANANGENESIG